MRLGWAPTAGEGDTTALLRALAIRIAATSKHTEVLTQARWLPLAMCLQPGVQCHVVTAVGCAGSQPPSRSVALCSLASQARAKFAAYAAGDASVLPPELRSAVFAAVLKHGGEAQ